MTHHRPPVPCRVFALAFAMLPAPMLNCRGLEAGPADDGASYSIHVTGVR